VVLVDAGVPGVGEVAARAVVVAHANGAEAGGRVDAGGALEVAEGSGESLRERVRVCGEVGWQD
jgi:hypothetical protein